MRCCSIRRGLDRAWAWGVVCAVAVLGLGATAHAGDRADDVAWVEVIEPVVPAEDVAAIEVHRRGDVVRITGGSPPPLPAAEGHVPVLLYLAMDGITLYPDCPGTLPYHSALDCTRIVSAPTTIEAMVDGALRTAFVQNVESLLADLDVVVTTERPPDWMPYVMVVAGGDGTWYKDNLCGVGSLACGATTRNVISFAFPGNGDCYDISATVAHELGHNLGLEHTSLEPDLMYPQNGHPRSPQDSCSPIVTEPDDPVSCSVAHAQVCPEQGGTAQNTLGELVLRVGPRRNDTAAPQIVSIYPDDGTTFTTEDRVVVGAKIEEDSGLVAVRWRWQQGAPPSLGAYSRCTNGVCDYDFWPADVAAGTYDFLALDHPPAGEYGFEIEAMDVYGNAVDRWIQFVVEEPSDSEPPDEGSTGASQTGGFDEPMSDADTDTAGEPFPPDYGEAMGEADGCGCFGGRPSPRWLALLLIPAARRRRSRKKREGGSSLEEPPSTRRDPTVVERADPR